MVTQDPTPQMVLCDEIRGDATRQGERLLRRARKEADALLANAKEEGERERREMEAHTREEAARRRDMILASVAVEAGRARAARVEALLRGVYDAAAGRLAARQGIDYRDTVVRLAAEAIRRMEGDALVVEISDQDQGVLGDDGLVTDIVQAAGRSSLELTLANRADAVPGELVIRDLAGRQVWENGLLTRLRRSWPALRGMVALLTRLVEPVQTKKGGG